MLISMMKSKVHRATLTDANLNYVGSLTLCKTLMEAANLREYEQVHIVNNNNGARLVTYIIEGKPNSGEVCLNGAAARLGEVGDILIIISYAQMTPEEASVFKPDIVFVDGNNKITEANKRT